jgi:hypothetical protein
MLLLTRCCDVEAVPTDRFDLVEVPEPEIGGAARPQRVRRFECPICRALVPPPS